MAQGQVHLATPEALLSMTDKASGCREVQGAKGRVEGLWLPWQQSLCPQEIMALYKAE